MVLTICFVEPIKKVLTIVAAASLQEWVFEGIKATIKTTARYLEWDDCGGIFAYGCYRREDIERTDYPKKAFELGFNLESVVMKNSEN